MRTVRKKMCDLLTFERSNRNIADDHPPGPYPLFGMKGVEKCVNFYDSAEPFIGLTIWGRIGEVKKLPAKSSTVSSIAIVKAKEGVDLNYLYYVLKSFNFRKYRVSLWAPKLRFDDWKDEEVEIIENIEDQKAVASLLDKIGELKEEQKKKAEKLEKFKKGLINLIYTPYGDSIRFEGYKSNVSLKALDELITASIGKGNTEGFYSVVCDGTLKPRTREVQKNKTAGKAVKPDEFVYNPARIIERSIALNDTGKTVTVSNLYNVFSTNSKLDSSYMKYFTRSEYFYKEVNRNLEGGVRKLLSLNNFKNITLPLPEIEEQWKNAGIARKIDDLAKENKRRYILIKKSYKPQRAIFWASSGMLKPVRLREVITLNNAGRIRMSSWERSYGNIPYYGSNGVIDYVDTVTHDGSYVLVAENGAVSLDNYPIHLSEDRKICASDHVHAVSGKNKIDLTYMYFLLKASRFHRWITGGTRYRLNANALLDVKTYVHTSRKDQKAIGLLLSKAEQLVSKAKEKEQLIQSLEENFLFFLKSVDRQKK